MTDAPRSIGDDQLYVSSHVGRDLIQCAATFHTEKRVVWEYVSNSIQYVDPGTSPRVDVQLNSRDKRIVISDNGRGMSWAGDTGLENFFVMHGENVDRQAGRGGRGRFGTGKSAAFGIADCLRITTTRHGKRSSVELTRADIMAMGSADPIPVKTLEKDTPTEQRNGTVVEIEGLRLRRLDIAGTRRFLERHLRHVPAQVKVRVNKQACEYHEPPALATRYFKPEGVMAEALGDVELAIKVSKVPLDPETRGIAISANGVWLETTMAGNEGREMAQYLFGFIDVPRFDEDDSSIPPFDMTRNMQLNPSNRLVQMVYAFCASKLDLVRRELVEQERQRRRAAEAQLLQREATHIEQILNQDFRYWRTGTQTRPRRSAGTRKPAGDRTASPAEPSRTGPQIARSAEEGASTRPRQLVLTGGPASPPSSFRVRFRNNGSDSYRAFYDRAQRAIFINLDHPQMVAARLADESEQTLRRLAYESAFTEYAIALQQERAEDGDFLDFGELLQEAREVVDRLGRRSADLYCDPIEIAS